MSRPTDATIYDWLRRRLGLAQDEIDAARKFQMFCRNWLDIEMHAGQLAFAGLVLARAPQKPNSAKFLTLWLAAGNRAGKTMLLAALIIYCCLDKTNRAKPITPADAERWLRAEYHWYHFGIAQEVADLVFNDIVRMLSGLHEAQKNGCPLTSAGPIADWDTKEYGDYRWVRFRQEVGGAQVHFRTTGEKGLSSLGKDMHGISFDEAGIERNLLFVIDEVFNLRRLGTGGQLVAVSTPSEDLGSDFADEWELGNIKNPKRLPSWRSLRMSTRYNVEYGLSSEMFERLVADMNARTIRQNIEGEFLQSKAAYFNGENVDACFYPEMPVVMGPRDGTTYLQGIDSAKKHDAAWLITFALAPNLEDPSRPFLIGVRADPRYGNKTIPTLIEMAQTGYSTFAGPKRVVYTALDATGFGGKMFRELIQDYVPNLTNIEFGGTVQKKRMLLGDVRTLIDENRLILPRGGAWDALRKQLLNYKLEDSKLEQDGVMALVCAVALLRRVSVSGVSSAPFQLYI